MGIFDKYENIQDVIDEAIKPIILKVTGIIKPDNLLKVSPEIQKDVQKGI